MKDLKKTVLFSLGTGSNIELPSAPRREFTYELLYKLVPYEPVSVRGAVMALRDINALSVYARQGQTRIQLTNVGLEVLRGSFPALKSSGGRRERTWTVCMLRSGTGQSLRLLRAELIDFGFFPLERGVYAIPSIISSDFPERLSRLHMLHRVLIFETKRMVVGDERSIVRSLFDIRAIEKERESIEKALTNLSRKTASKSRLHHETKELFTSLIPKLMIFFSKDLNVPDIYFPQEIKLSEVKQSLFQVSAEILPRL